MSGEDGFVHTSAAASSGSVGEGDFECTLVLVVEGDMDERCCSEPWHPDSGEWSNSPRSREYLNAAEPDLDAKYFEPAFTDGSC